MGKCLGCGKKPGWLEGYSDSEGEYCNNCYPKRDGILKKKEHNLKEEKPQKTIKKKEDKKTVKNNKSNWNYSISLILIALLVFWAFEVF